MRNCPQCGASVDGLRCPACGFAEPGSSVKAPADPLHWTCCHLDRGMRCAEPGTLTFNGCGPEGPKAWYCHRHFPPLAGMRGVRTLPPQGFVGLRQTMHHALPDQETIAERQAIESEADML